MTKTIALLWVLSILLAGCASTAKSPYTIVSFVEVDDTGKLARSLKFKLTEKPADTCISGNWKAAKVVSDKEKYTRRPAYILKEGQLEVLLVNGFCDAYDSYIGTVSDGTFKGEHVMYGLDSSESVGKVSGTYSIP